MAAGLAGDGTLETFHHGPVEGLIVCGAAPWDVDALHARAAVSAAANGKLTLCAPMHSLTRVSTGAARPLGSAPSPGTGWIASATQ